MVNTRVVKLIPNLITEAKRDNEFMKLVCRQFNVMKSDMTRH